jgi:fatty acid desaturase
MGDRGSVWQEARPGSSWDPDASRAAARLSAYFELEAARASRRRLCRIAVVIACAAALLHTITRAFPGPILYVVWLALGTLALVSAIVEWRAERHLGQISHPDSPVSS